MNLPQALIIFIMHLEMWNLSSDGTWFLRFYNIAFFTNAHIECLIESFFFLFCNILDSTAVSKKVNVIFPICDFASQTEFNNKGLRYRVNIFKKCVSWVGLCPGWQVSRIRDTIPHLLHSEQTLLSNCNFPEATFQLFSINLGS